MANVMRMRNPFFLLGSIINPFRLLSIVALVNCLLSIVALVITLELMTSVNPETKVAPDVFSLEMFGRSLCLVLWSYYKQPRCVGRVQRRVLLATTTCGLVKICKGRATSQVS